MNTKIIFFQGILNISLVGILVGCISYSQSAIPSIRYQRGDDWKIATFQGLTLGSSVKADVLKHFGPPDWEGLPEGSKKTDMSSEWWMDFDSVTEMNHHGKLSVALNKKSVVVRVTFYPLNMNKSALIDNLGKDFIVTRYSFEPCDEKFGGSARIYESKNGQLEFIEYRSKGIAITLGGAQDEKVISIQYVSVPIGSKISQCKAAVQVENDRKQIPLQDIRKGLFREVLGLKLGQINFDGC